MPERTSAGVTRRKVLKWSAGAAIGGLVLGGQARAAGAGDGRLYVRGAGGVLDELQKKYVDSVFTKETGIEVAYEFIQPAGKLSTLAKTTGIPVDITSTPEIVAASLHAGGYLEEIDWSRIRTPRDDLVKTTDYSVPLQISADILAFNTKRYGAGLKTPPTSWADIWDLNAFPGRRILADIAQARPPIEIALLADGVAMKDLYPLDLDRAFAKLQAIKPNILKFYHSAGEHDQLYSTEQVDLGEALSGRIGALAIAGAPYDFTWNQGVKSPQCYGIVKGSKMVDAAYKWLDVATRPEVQAKFVSPDLMYAPANRKSLEHVPPEWRKYMATSPEAEANSFFLDTTWWAQNFDKVVSLWQKFLV